MSGADFPTLIDELGAASLAAKELLREVHGAVKDMRAVLAESAAERKRWEETVRAAMEADIGDAVKAGLEDYKATLAKAIADSEQAIYKRFDTIGNMLINGDTKGKGASILDLAIDSRIRANAAGVIR